MWNLKYDTNVLINETETESQAQRTDLWLPKKGWIGMQTNIYIEWINNKVLLYSPWNYIHYPVSNHNGKEYEKECAYV